ncbi:hypothetical protein EP331_10700 [bacterium]|nr:MAG: hypothetical protein EP331_10700 [bacterium]
MSSNSLSTIIFNDEISFKERASLVFEYQAEMNPVFKKFIQSLGYKNSVENNTIDFPLLPIGAFKEKTLISDEVTTQNALVFMSSGTSAMSRSKHWVPFPDLYKKSISQHFDAVFQNLPILAYLPGYADNPHSSLIYMIQFLIDEKRKVGDTTSAFLKLDIPLKEQLKSDIPVILFGAAFGLLDATESESIKLHPDSILVETGGMKTFRKEMSKSDLQNLLLERYTCNSSQLYSEYGMAELLSQAYKQGTQKPFYPPNWMRISIRNPENPLEEMPSGEVGQIGVIDLANIYSCSFILTEDRGFATEDGGFEVLGRLSDSELRGCNFLLERD